MATKKAPQVDDTSMAHSMMSIKWNKINSLMGGTETMRAAAAGYLPKHAEEDHENWKRRLERSVLTNLYRRTVRSLSGRPFTEEIKRENLPEPLEDMSDDVDKLGNNIDVFARQVFQEGIAKGHTAILVDFPPVTELNDDGSKRTLADEIRDGIAPYFVNIHPESIIAAFADVVGGVEMLTHVRIRENIIEREGMFGEREVKRIRVLEPGTWTLWELVKIATRKEEWRVVSSGATNLPFIPLVVFYTDREGLMFTNPPLMDIANLNIAHWQSASDQRHILTVARFPILASSGVVDIGTTVIGPNEHLNTPDTQGRFYYVEHGGAAIEAGRQDMEDLKEEMVTLAMEPLLRKAGNVTATQRAIDAAEGHSDLQNLAIKFSEFLTIAYTMAAMWLQIDMPEDAAVRVFTEFGPTSQESKDIDQLIKMRAQGDISRESFYVELMRRNFLDIGFDPAAEESKIEDEAPNLNMLKGMSLAVDNTGGDDGETKPTKDGNQGDQATEI
jgi:hypothetical protein